MSVYTPCEKEAVMEQGLTPIGTRWLFTNKGDTQKVFSYAPDFWRKNQRRLKDLTDAFMTFAATPPVEGFRFLLSSAMTGEKNRSVQDEVVIGFF